MGSPLPTQHPTQFIHVKQLDSLSFQNAWSQKELHPVEVSSVASSREVVSSPRPQVHGPLRFKQMQLPQEWAWRSSQPRCLPSVLGP